MIRRPTPVQKAIFANDHKKLSDFGKAGARKREANRKARLMLEAEAGRLFAERKAAQDRRDENSRWRQANEHTHPLTIYE